MIRADLIECKLLKKTNKPKKTQNSICNLRCFSSSMGTSTMTAPSNASLCSLRLIGFPLPYTIHFFFFPFSPPFSLAPHPPTPLLVECPVSTGAFEQFEIKANNGQALPGTSRSPYYTEDARVLLRIIGKSLRFSGNREQELALRNR